MRQAGQGLGSPACGPLKSAWTADFLGRSMKLFRATLADLARHLRIRATDAQRRGATACVSEPLPSLPLATLFYGRHSVSRPIEGLDSHGAVRTLRTASWLANGCASRRHRRRLNVAGRDLGFGVRSRISHDRRFGEGRGFSVQDARPDPGVARSAPRPQALPRFGGKRPFDTKCPRCRQRAHHSEC